MAVIEVYRPLCVETAQLPSALRREPPKVKKYVHFESLMLKSLFFTIVTTVAEVLSLSRSSGSFTYSSPVSWSAPSS